MPIIEVHMFKRPPEVKARIAERITQIISEEGKVSSAGIEVIFTDLDSDGYSLGGKIAKPSAPNVVKD